MRETRAVQIVVVVVVIRMASGRTLVNSRTDQTRQGETVVPGGRSLEAQERLAEGTPLPCARVYVCMYVCVGLSRLSSSVGC